MEENQPTTPQNQEAPAAQPAPTNLVKKKLYNKPWFIVAVCAGGLLLLLIPVILLMLLNSGGASGSAADKFYKMIEVVAQKSKIRYAYTLSIPEGAQYTVDVKSLSEYDAATGEYSTAYASEAITAAAGRCVKGIEYESAAEQIYADDFKEAEQILKGPYKVNDDKFSVGSCEFLKPSYRGNFTDGILAVGLKPEQAANMAKELRDKDPAKLRDEGKVAYKGKTARKISFEVGRELTGKSHQSDVFFYSFRDGTSSAVGANVPLSDISKHFDDAFHVPAVGLKGFYLIDEKTNLPIYRYLETTADGAKEGFAPRTVMGEYSFPDTLTMDETTQLPEITKP